MSIAPQTTLSGQKKRDTSQWDCYEWVTIICEFCKNPKRKRIAKAQPRGRRFCNTTCSAHWRNQTAAVQHRMRNHNPMTNVKARLKMTAALKGRPFPVPRGGNGKPVLRQRHLAALFTPAPVLEYTLGMKALKAKKPNLKLANGYKIDLAWLAQKLAVELDGASHNTRRIQKLDQKKTRALEWYGWTVLRFSNLQVDTDLALVQKSIASKLTELTASSLTVS